MVQRRSKPTASDLSRLLAVRRFPGHGWGLGRASGR
jgi:hypothetical protein